MANTRDTMGEQACLDALVANTLTSFEDSDITRVGQFCLENKALTEVKLPSCTFIDNGAMRNCANLTAVDILGGGRNSSGAYTFGSNAFSGDSNLKHLVLRSTTKSLLYNTDVFANATALRTGEGAVYVPQDLVAQYKADSTWKYYLVLPISAYPATVFETISDSWDDIIAACSNGTYSSKYVIGDVKSIVIDGTTYYMQLVAKDADVLASDGTTTVPTTWIMYRKIYTNHDMNTVAGSASTSGGWSGSAMRSWLSDTVMPLMPVNVQSAIKEVRKYSDTCENSTVVHDQQTADKLWIPSAREIIGGTSYEQTGPVYDGVYDSSMYSKIKYNTAGNGCEWWLRSVYSTSSTSFSTIGLSGYSSNGPSNMSKGTCLGFCI